jgi:hypothetical protein
MAKPRTMAAATPKRARMCHQNSRISLCCRKLTPFGPFGASYLDHARLGECFLPNGPCKASVRIADNPSDYFKRPPSDGASSVFLATVSSFVTIDFGRYDVVMGSLVGNVTMDITNWLGQMQQEMDACLADLAQVSVASERKNYADNLAALQFGVSRLILVHLERLEAKAPERAARACFLSAIGKFISFLDKLIASQRVSKDGISINRNLSIDDLQNYVNEYMEERIAKVAKDMSLTNPKKIACFPGANAMISDTALEYFELRRTLEHHQDVPEKELVVHVHRMALVVMTLRLQPFHTTSIRGRPWAFGFQGRSGAILPA